MENSASARWLYIPVEWLQNWQFHQIYYWLYLHRIARPNGHFCHSAAGMRKKPMAWVSESGAPRGLRRSQMFVARAFLRDEGLIHIFPSRFGTVGKFKSSPWAEKECLAVRWDVLERITSPDAWIDIRLQILLAHETAKAEKERGHTSPAGRRPCLGVREFKSRLAVVPHWKYLAPVMHAPAALGALFPPWQAAALALPCTMADRPGGPNSPIAAKSAFGPCTTADIEGIREREINNTRVSGRVNTAEGWRIPLPVYRHIRTELTTLCHEEGITPAALGDAAGLAIAAANIEHRRAGGAALGGYRHALADALGAVFYVREVADRKTRVSELARVLDQVRRFHCGGYWQQWAANLRFSEMMEYEARREDAPGETAPEDFEAFILEGR